MAAKLKAQEVFIPSAFPIHTYIRREDEKLERRLRDSLATPGEIISLSGPSKSGKTVLVERVVGQDELITVTGAGLERGDDLWTRILNWMGAPTESKTEESRGIAGEVGTAIEGSVGIPLLAQGKVEGVAKVAGEKTSSTGSSFHRTGLQQVVKEIANSSFVVLIDDFHYMPRELQSQVAKEIKEAARLGVKICTASVPHRSDDVVRSNPELRGRVKAIDFGYWQISHLKRIAEVGFPLLGVAIDDETIAEFAKEASGSPQLMQALCLQTCFSVGVRETLDPPTKKIIDKAMRGEIFEETSTRADFKSLVDKSHRGPKSRGTERKEFFFKDDTIGDVYRAVLLSIAADPPALSFPYATLSQRIATVSLSDTPQPASIYQACSQISKLAVDMYPNQRVIEWDTRRSPACRCR